jgi:hypothetical protein
MPILSRVLALRDLKVGVGVGVAVAVSLERKGESETRPDPGTLGVVYAAGGGNRRVAVGVVRELGLSISSTEMPPGDDVGVVVANVVCRLRTGGVVVLIPNSSDPDRVGVAGRAKSMDVPRLLGPSDSPSPSVRVA